MNILIIGGTNFIGACVANEFVQNNHKVTVFHRNLYFGEFLDKKVNHCMGDRKNLSDLAKAIKNTNPDIIVDMFAMCKNDVLTLGSAVIKKTRVVIISSCDVYRAYSVIFKTCTNAVEVTPINEKSSIRDVLYPYRGVYDFEYAHDYEKILVEKTALDSPMMDVIILRLGMVYGENDPNRRFSNIIEQMRKEVSEIHLSREMSQWITSKGYIQNISSGIILATLKGQSNEIYNLAEETPVTELEWIQRIATQMKWFGEIIYDLEENSNLNLQQNLLIDTKKIRSKLGYKEKISIDEGLEKTISWELCQ